MKNMSTRKILALSFSAAYIVLVVACIFLDKNVPAEFTTIVASVVSFYFAKSTALDMPKGGGGGDEH